MSCLLRAHGLRSHEVIHAVRGRGPTDIRMRPPRWMHRNDQSSALAPCAAQSNSDERGGRLHIQARLWLGETKTMKFINSISTLFGACAVLLLIITVSAAWSALWLGMALSVLWGWIIVPMFGLAPITVVQAYGLMLVVRLITIKIDLNKDRSGFNQAARNIIVAPPMVAVVSLFIGWIISAWV